MPRGGPARAVSRRRVLVAVVAVVVAVVVPVSLAAWYVGRPAAGQGRPPDRADRPRMALARPGLPAAESGLLPWRLPGPVSREVVAAGPDGQLMMLGGLTPGGNTVASVYRVATAKGRISRAGALPVAVHDAAGAVVGGQALVLGGGAAASVRAVQAFPVGPHTSSGAVAGSLPSPRSDVVAVSVAGTAYVIGGYSGTRASGAVLATTDGRSFTRVASLPIPVRYPAATALGGTIFVFGGQAITGPRAGDPVSAIQAISPARHTATVIGQLPEPLTGALAVTLGGEVFVAGGETTVPQHQVPGFGTTQLRPGQLAPMGGTGGPVTSTVSTIWAFDPASARLLAAGHLQVPVSHAGAAVTGGAAWVLGGESGGSQVDAVQLIRPDRAFGTAGAAGAGSPYFGGQLLIADRGNNRLLLLDAADRLVWKYPSAATPRDRLGFYFPDDAFFIHHGTAIISNQEQNNTIVEIAYPSGKILWDYGHPRTPGTGPGYLHEPDDAYLLRNGQVTVADAQNCRVLIINPAKTVAHQIGTSGACAHRPPGLLGSPNGDTPLRDGNLLISEINGSWVSEYTPAGRLVWTTHLPISYPSDPQQLGADRYLLADYSSPGAIVEFNRAGRVLYRYGPASGPGELDQPSLVEQLPDGVFLVNDDYHHRMAAIDPATGALVWQYGVTGRAGTGPGRLRVPDGFDVLFPGGATPTHPFTG